MIIPAFYVCKRWYRIVRYRLAQPSKLWHPDDTDWNLMFRAPIHRMFLGQCITQPDHPLRTWALSSPVVILGREFKALSDGGSIDTIKISLRALQPVTISNYVLGALCIMAAANGNLTTYRYAKAVTGPMLNEYTCQCIVAYSQYLIQSNAPSEVVQKFLLRQEGRHLLQRHTKWLARSKLCQIAKLHVTLRFDIVERICDHSECRRLKLRAKQLEEEWIYTRRCGNPDRPSGMNVPHCDRYRPCRNAAQLLQV